MSLTAKDVAEITRLLEQSSFDELYLEIDGLKLSLRRGAAVAQPMAALPTLAPLQFSTSVSPAAPPTVQPSAPAPPTVQPSTPAPPTVSADSVDVTAPMLGTFYRSPKPGAPPFVEIGSKVEEDTLIGIIEVMKLMNTVRAGVRGVVSQIVGRDGVLVEYGEVLIRVSKTP